MKEGQSKLLDLQFSQLPRCDILGYFVQRPNKAIIKDSKDAGWLFPLEAEDREILENDRGLS